MTTQPPHDPPSTPGTLEGGQAAKSQSRSYPLCPPGGAGVTAFPLCMKGPENLALYNNLSDVLVEWTTANGVQVRRFESQSQVRMYSVWGVSMVKVSVFRVSECV